MEPKNLKVEVFSLHADMDEYGANSRHVSTYA
jgi:hypothetical protein